MYIHNIHIYIYIHTHVFLPSSAWSKDPRERDYLKTILHRIYGAPPNSPCEYTLPINTYNVNMYIYIYIYIYVYTFTSIHMIRF